MEGRKRKENKRTRFVYRPIKSFSLYLNIIFSQLNVAVLINRFFNSNFYIQQKRLQKAKLNSSFCEWEVFTRGVLQGSICGFLLFYIYLTFSYGTFSAYSFLHVASVIIPVEIENSHSKTKDKILIIHKKISKFQPQRLTYVKQGCCVAVVEVRLSYLNGRFLE